MAVDQMCQNRIILIVDVKISLKSIFPYSQSSSHEKMVIGCQRVAEISFLLLARGTP